MLREKFIQFKVHIRKEKRSQINNLSFFIKTLEKRETKLKVRRKGIIKRGVKRKLKLKINREKKEANVDSMKRLKEEKTFSQTNKKKRDTHYK